MLEKKRTTVKRILKYINCTSDYGILYSHNENSMLIGNCDAGWEGSADDRNAPLEDASFLETILEEETEESREHEAVFNL